MKLSTGLRPTVRMFRMPPTAARAALQLGDGVLTTEVPTALGDVVWVVELAAPRDSREHRLGTHLGTLITTTEPTVTEHDYGYPLWDGDPWDEVDAHYRARHGAPADAVVVDVPLMFRDGIRRSLRWWEVVA